MLQDYQHTNKLINVCKASDLGKEHVESKFLIINDDFPDEGTSEEFYQTQAKLVHDALSSLPQGTKHRLLIMLLQDKMTLYMGK